MLSAGLSILFPVVGTTVQIIIGMLLILAFYGSYCQAKPYKTETDKALTFAGDWMQIMSLLYTYVISTDGLKGVINKAMAYEILDKVFGCLSITFIFLNIFIIMNDYVGNNNDHIDSDTIRREKNGGKGFMATQEVLLYRGQSDTFQNLHFLSYFRKKLEKFQSKQLQVISFIICNRLMLYNMLY